MTIAQHPHLARCMPHGPFDRDAVHQKLKWLMSIRLTFGLLLLGSTVVYQIGHKADSTDVPVALLYGLSGTIVCLSILDGVARRMLGRYQSAFIYCQIAVDALCITLIIYVTGGYASVFSFLYLIVIIYSSVFIPKRGTILVAALCSAQFALLLILEFNGVIDPFGNGGLLGVSTVPAVQVLQKWALMTAACFSVALLSGYLSDQERRSKAELAAMEVHLNRVQNLAQIGEMAAGLAHEIKNPLASLSGAIQILNGEMEKNTDNLRLMHIVLRETNRLSSLVNNFLTFARPSAGQTQSVHVGAMISEMIALFEKDRSVGDRIQVDLNVISDGEIEIDPLQLRQVIWNLLLNGAESIEAQGTIRLSVQALKNDRIKVVFADDGCGMDSSTIESIFNPFFTTKPTGTGLGLSIVYRILETCDCRMDVQSAPGGGSTFTLYFRSLPSALNRR